MNLTIGNIIDKIDAINLTIEELDKLSKYDACTNALSYLEEYVDILKDTKVII